MSGIQLNLEPFPFYGGALRDRGVMSVGPKSVVFDQPKDKTQSLTLTLNALFARGGFRSLTEENVRARPEDQPYDDPMHTSSKDLVEVAAGTQKEELHNKSDLMPYEAMIQTKWEIVESLREASNRLHQITQLVQSLLPPPHSANPPMPPQLPPPPILVDSISVTATTQAVDTFRNNIETTKVALARNRKGLRDARLQLSAAASGIKKRETQEVEFWKNLRELKAGVSTHQQINGGTGRTGVRKNRWDVVASPVHTGVKTEVQQARDVMIPYAPDEAALRLRQSSFASFKPDTASSKPDDSEDASFLQLPRTFKKHLRVSLNTAQDGTQCSRLNLEPELSLADTLERAQDQVFDGEIFSWIVEEALKDSKLDSRLSEGKLEIKAGPSTELTFELIDFDDDDEGLVYTASPVPALLLACIKLLAIRKYRFGLLEKSLRRLHALTDNPTRPTEPELPSPTPILASVMPFLTYRAFCGQLESLLESLRLALGEMGMTLDAEWEDQGHMGGLGWKTLLEGSADGALCIDNSGGSVELVLESGHLGSILIKSDCTVTLILRHVTLSSDSIAQLPLILANEVRKGVLQTVTRCLGPEVGKVAIDEYAGTLTTKGRKLQIEMTGTPLRFQASVHHLGKKTPVNPKGDSALITEYESGRDGPFANWFKVQVQ